MQPSSFRDRKNWPEVTQSFPVQQHPRNNQALKYDVPQYSQGQGYGRSEQTQQEIHFNRTTWPKNISSSLCSTNFHDQRRPATESNTFRTNINYQQSRDIYQTSSPFMHNSTYHRNEGQVWAQHNTSPNRIYPIIKKVVSQPRQEVYGFPSQIIQREDQAREKYDFLQPQNKSPTKTKSTNVSWNKIFCEDFEFGIFDFNKRESYPYPKTFVSYHQEISPKDSPIQLCYPTLPGKASKKIQLQFSKMRIDFTFDNCETIYYKDEGNGWLTLYFHLSCIPRFETKLPGASEFSRTFNFVAPKNMKGLLRDFLTRSTVIKVSFKDKLDQVQKFLGRDKVNLISVDLKESQVLTTKLTKYPYLTFKTLSRHNLSFDIKFALLVCLSHKKISLYEITKQFMEDIEERDPEMVHQTLINIAKSPRKFDSFKKEHFSVPFLELFDTLYEESRFQLENHQNSSSLCKIRTVTVTPTVINYGLGDFTLSNGVLRRYEKFTDYFLRVTFSDDIGKSINGLDFIIKKRLRPLADSLRILDRTYKHLAYSASQLRKSSMWMFADTDGMTSEKILSELGDFNNIKVSALNGARRGQLFSASLMSLDLRNYGVKIKRVADIPSDSEQYFSDGIGKISTMLLNVIRKMLKITETICAIQIRLGGVKGLLVEDPGLEGYVIAIRESMIKFSGSLKFLDVLDYNTYHPAYLNKQIIILLLANQLKDNRVLLNLQRDNLRDLDCNNVESLLSYISMDNSITSVKELFRSCIANKIDINKEPFLFGVTSSIRISSFRHTLESRLLVKEGALLTGVLDEWGALGPGEVYVRISPSNGKDKNDTQVIEGKVIVTKNPCLHPGDVRPLEAVDSDLLNRLPNLVNCIVFPAVGKRPHTNEIAGSDLDGDKYFISWDERLIPLKTPAPMLYDTHKPQEQDSVSTKDVVDFFFEFSCHNHLGKIDNAHLAFADYCIGNGKDLDEKCQELAELHAICVDYSKKGIRPDLSKIEFPEYFPVHMGKESHKTKPSNSILEELCSKMKKKYSNSEMQKVYKKGLKIPQEAIKINPGIIFKGFQEYLPFAFEVLETYYEETCYFMSKFGIRSEFEVYSGSFLKLKKNGKYSHKSPTDLAQVQEKAVAHNEGLQKMIQDRIENVIKQKKNGQYERNKIELQIASAFYIAAYYNQNCPFKEINYAMKLIQYEMRIKPKFEKYNVQMIGLPWYIFKDIIVEHYSRQI